MEPSPAQAGASDRDRSPPPPSQSSTAATISSPLAVVCSFWKDFDLEKERSGLDEQGLKIAENQETSQKNRRKLAENTRDFKKASSDEKLSLFNSLLKSYQEEVDNLTKRAKFGENAFLNIYQKLYEAPDPYPALASMADQDQKLSELETENRKMKLELEEYRAEAAHLKNQQATIRRLEERNRQLEQQMEEKVREMVEMKQRSMAEDSQKTLEALKDSDINLILNILQLFGEASGLKTNLQKSNAYPIQCSDTDIMVLQDSLPCEILDFPCKYLGIPLSMHKLTRAQVQPIIDRIADLLPGWKADLLSRAGRRILVQFVLTSTLVYLAMALDLPAWALKAIDKIRRGFLWKGRKDVRGGHCLVSWPKACRPPELGGLGISDLQRMGWALRMRWLWLQKTEPNKPWSAFSIQVHQSVRAFFSVAIISKVGDGAHTLFWKDRWINGQRVADLAPQIFAIVSKRRANKRTVLEALTNNGWIADIQGAHTVGVIIEFLTLWDILSEVVLQPGVEDAHIWRLSTSGQYSAKSAYEGFFIGSTEFRPWERIWKTWAPGKCRFFMWLVAHNKCWTADRLARRGLPHPARCPHCDQEEETINHLLVSCVFAREFWFVLLRRVRLQDLSPQQDEPSFDEWWAKAESRMDGTHKKRLNSLIILGAWTIWNHRNRCVFDGTPPNLVGALLLASEEQLYWNLAKAQRSSFPSLEPVVM